MAMILALSPTYRVKVTVELPNQHGKIDKSDFMAEFKRVLGDDVDELRKIPGRDVIKEVLVGTQGLKDENGSEVPFSASTLQALLAIPQASVALVEAFWSSVYKAKEKN